MNLASLKRRVILVVVIILVATITTICIVAHSEFQESHLRTLDQTLRAMVNGVLASAGNSQDNDVLIEDIRAVTGTNGGNSGALCRVWMDGASSDLFCTDIPASQDEGILQSLPEEERPPKGQTTFFNIGRTGTEYRSMWARQGFKAGILNVVVATSSRYTYHEMGEFLQFMVVLGVSLIVASVVLVVFGVRWALEPVDNVAQQLQEIEQPSSPRLLPRVEDVPEELRPFIRSLTDMLDRLASVFERERRFTADAAHELRTPLALVKSTLQAAQMTPMEICEYRSMIDETMEDIARIERLVQQLLFLARMDEAAGAAVTSEIQLDTLLGELADNLGARMSRSGGRLLFEEPPPVSVQGNLDELICLFRNVLENAMKYGPAGGTIRVSLSQERNGYAAVRIHDEGGSIPPDLLPRLFDRFYRVDQSRSSSTGGTGLGLAIAKEIVNRHHGDISITSEPQSGTLVLITLPMLSQRATGVNNEESSVQIKVPSDNVRPDKL